MVIVLLAVAAKRMKFGGVVKSEKVEKISLSEAVTHLLEECRMVLPGIQALFGFQLIVVFNPTFYEKLSLLYKVK